MGFKKFGAMATPNAQSFQPKYPPKQGNAFSKPPTQNGMTIEEEKQIQNNFANNKNRFFERNSSQVKKF